MRGVYFFTGYPGFITSALLKKLVKEDYDIEKIYLLVLPSQMEKALNIGAARFARLRDFMFRL